MPQPDCLALAADCLPGRGAVELQQLGSGPAHDTFRARRDGRQFALRVVRAPDGQGQAAREFEAQLVARAAACDLAPHLIFSDAARGVLVLDWLSGQPWDAAAVGEAGHIEAAGALIRRVHALIAPAPARRDSPAGWVARYRRGLAGRTERTPAFLHEAADRVLERLAALRAEAAVVCHSDLHRLNLLRRPDGGLQASVLLDWEYAHCAEPGWDLAGWSANNDFTAPQSRLLLSAYEGGGPDRERWQRFVLLRWLFDYVCLLWIRLFGLAAPGGAVAYTARAELLETRLNAAVCGKLADFDRHYFLEI